MKNEKIFKRKVVHQYLNKINIALLLKCPSAFSNMTDSSLYRSCLRKIAINLREGIYKSCQENPFCFMPSKIVNDIMATALDHERDDGLRVGDLEQLLTSGKLRELKICDTGLRDLTPQLQVVSQVLHFLKDCFQELETLHLPVLNNHKDWIKTEESVARTRNEVSAATLRSEISKALGNLLVNAPNLIDLHCCFSFDLKALRNCRTLCRPRVHFIPLQHWYEFLEEEEGHFKPHKCLEFFTVCQICYPTPIQYDDLAIILRHCPQITSLGLMESSGALGRLHRMDASSFKLSLRHCCWRDKVYDSNTDQWKLNRIEEAVMKHPMVEELDFSVVQLGSISCLKNLKHLVYLNVCIYEEVSCTAFNDALQAIGPQLKHLSFSMKSQIDFGLLLPNFRSLDSLRIQGYELVGFPDSATSLPNLQRLTLKLENESGGRVLRLLADCNQLTELFLLSANYLDDQTLQNFLERNSVSSLKVAFLHGCGLTEPGFREFLLNAPKLEKVHINGELSNDYEGVITTINHKVQFCKSLTLAYEEFFLKRSDYYACDSC